MIYAKCREARPASPSPYRQTGHAAKRHLRRKPFTAKAIGARSAPWNRAGMRVASRDANSIERNDDIDSESDGALIRMRFLRSRNPGDRPAPPLIGPKPGSPSRGSLNGQAYRAPAHRRRRTVMPSDPTMAVIGFTNRRLETRTGVILDIGGNSGSPLVLAWSPSRGLRLVDGDRSPRRCRSAWRGLADHRMISARQSSEAAGNVIAHLGHVETGAAPPRHAMTVPPSRVDRSTDAAICRLRDLHRPHSR